MSTETIGAWCLASVLPTSRVLTLITSLSLYFLGGMNVNKLTSSFSGYLQAQEGRLWSSAEDDKWATGSTAGFGEEVVQRHEEENGNKFINDHL